METRTGVTMESETRKGMIMEMRIGMGTHDLTRV